MKIKILHITHAHGGIKTYIENIVNHADPEKFENYIVGTDVSKYYNNVFKAKYDIFIDRKPNIIKDITALIKAIHIIRIINPDIIHCHSAKGGFIGRLASKLTRKKCIYTPNAFSYLGFVGIKRQTFKFLEKITKNITDILLSVSYSEANRAEVEIGYPKDKIVTIKNCIKVAENTNLNYNYHKDKIGMIGRLIHQKNPLMFLNVALIVHKELPNLKFELLGAGYQDYLSDEVAFFIKKNNMHDYCSIKTWGTNKNEIIDFYRSLSIFILTSNFEGLPYSLLEAMAEGIPCITTDADGNRDVINSGNNGFLVKCNDAFDMATKIIQLKNNEILYKEISKKSFQTIYNDHNIEKNITLYENIYLNLN